MDISTIRSRIDDCDRRIVALLNERVSLAAEIGKLKRGSGAPIYVAEREEEVLRNVIAQSKGPLSDAALRAIYREVMSAAIALEKPMAIAYLGPEATYTHQAAMRKFGASVEYHPMSSISDVFAAVEKGEADYGVIPIENSTEGAVFHSLDMFAESDLKIVAQVYLEIAHALISASPLEKIERVYSKDNALGQCRKWLQRNLPHAQCIDAPSTARAVQIAQETPGSAAIASAMAAEIYGIPVAAANIQDRADNTTRFLIVGPRSSGPVGNGRDKSSFLVSLNDEPGALHQMLQPFSQRGINLTKIESRPSKLRPWDYHFFIDIVGHHEEPLVQEAVAELKKICPLVKWLGSYPNTH